MWIKHANKYKEVHGKVIKRACFVTKIYELSSVEDWSMIIYYKCYKSHEMSAQQYIMIGGVAPVHNIVIEILIPTKRFLVLSFYIHEDCVNCIILMGALFSMNI